MFASVSAETHVRKRTTHTDITCISVILRVTEKANNPALRIKTPDFLQLSEMQKKSLYY